MVRRILCHFPAKEHLLAALVEPLLADLEGLLDPRSGCRVDASRRAVVRGRSRRRPGRPRALDRE
ncbi:hypothetical protein [Micromonospora avicenniae]|uniref:hypothetical protein n=1 Tax=Micromonospora avicenniae TaxID=1198245 RepID=UPI0033226C1E